MPNTLSTPWDFAGDNQQFLAPDGQHCLRYETDGLREIGMGGPLYGPCFWVRPDGSEVLLHATCGGPPVWQRQGSCAALPIWRYSWLRSWSAVIGVLALGRQELVLFSERFSVLQLELFDGQMITGIESPIYRPQTLKFDVSVAAVKRIVCL